MPHVTIPDSRAEIVYGSVTGTGPLNFTFAYLAKDDLKVRVDGVLLASNAWSVAPSQTVSGGFIGGNITLNAAVTAAEVIITRETEPGRTTDFAAGGAKPDAINTDLDRVHAILRDMKTLVIERGFRLPAGDNSGPLILGDAATRAETVIAFDENGDLDPVSRVNVDIVAGIAQNIIDLSEPLVVTAIQTLSAAEVIAALLILDDVPDEVIAVAAILEEIIALYAVATEITALAAVIPAVVTVADNIAAVSTAADNIAAVSTAADNIAAINAAPGHAATASTKAAEAAAWSDADIDEPVEGVTGDTIIFNPATAVNTTTNVITIVGHGFADWQQLRYRHGGGTSIGGLTHDANVWAEVIDADTFTPSATRYGATIDLTSVGAGTAHEFLPLRSSKHNAEYARVDAREAETNALAAIEILALVQQLAKPGSYVNASAVVAAFPSDPAPYVYLGTDENIYILKSVSPPLAILFDPFANIFASFATMAALKASTTASVPAAIEFAFLKGYHATANGGGALFAIIRSSAAAAGLVANEATVIENTAQTLTFVEVNPPALVSLKRLGARTGESQTQAVYEANDAAIERFKSVKQLAFLDGMIGLWTTKNFRDAMKLWASGFALIVATGQDNNRAAAAGLVYKGGATNDPFIWHLESPVGVQPGTVVLTFDPTGAELDVAGNYIEKANTFVEGEYVTYSNGGGTSIGGLTSGNRYYVKDKGVGGANRFKLAATRGGAAIDLTAGATGTAHTLTQADTNLEGVDLRGVTIDGGAAKYAYVTGRNGYGNSVDRCTFRGGTDTAVAILNGFGVKWGHNWVGPCPNVGLRIGENLFGFLTTERYAFAVEGSFHVLYAGHDATLTKQVDYTVVRATLNDADGSEDDGPNTAETRRYLVGTSPTGTFAGHANEIAEYDPSGPSWGFVAKANGAIVYDMTANNALLFNGTTWSVDNTKIEKGAGAIVLTTRQGPGLHFTTIERCAGWGFIGGSRANFGPFEVSIGYLERNAGGVLITYENNSRAPVVNIGFANPGSTHPEQTICIRGQSSVSGATADWLSSATPLADAGPADEAHYLVVNLGHAYNDAGTDGVSLYSDTGKYFVYARDAKIHYGNKVPRNYVDPAQTAVYVNDSTGHDAYPGTSAKPLKSLTEALRRRRLNPLINTINMVGSFTGQSADLGGQQGGTVTVDGGGTANLNQSANNVDAVLVKGKGCRLKFQNFASIGKVTASNADVEIVGNITAMSAGYDDNSEPDTPGTSSAHYGLWVEDDANVHLVGNVDADKARGLRVDSSRLRLYGTVTNYDTGVAVIVNDGAQIESNALPGDANALNLIGANAAGGAGAEGFITFKDGSVYSYESQAMQSGDPWTYLKVASDQASTSTSNANITGLNFVPAINTQYEFEALLILQSAATTTGAKVTIAWPGGTVDEGVASIEHPNGSATAFLTQMGNKGAAISTAGTDFPAANASYPCRIKGTFKQGATVSASLRPGIASEVNGSAITVKAGSFIKYRAI